MSKKSRRRNKRLLALAGLAGAVALSRRKAKADLASTEDGKSAGFSKPTIADVSGPTKDTSVKTSKTIQDNKDTSRKKSMAETSTVPKKRPGITVYDDGSIKAKDKGSGNFVNYANKEKYSTRMDTKPPGASGGKSKPFSFIDPSKSSFAQNQAKQGLRSGGRAGLKSGGKVKGCGKALRGFGKAMKGKR